MTRLTTLTLLGLLALLTGPASAQAQARGSGLGGALSDPSGARPPRTEADFDQVEVPDPVGYGEGPRGGDTAPGALDPEPDVTLRLRALDATFAALASRGGPDYLRGVLSLLGGGAEIALGAILLELGGIGELMAPYFIVLGGVTIVRSILIDFVLPPNPTPAAIEYQQMPSGTRAQRMARLAYGEEQLASLAEQSLILRVVDGSLNMAAALAIIPAYLVPLDFTITDPLQAFIFVGPGIALITGIITLATPSGAEKRWDAYRQMRDRLAQDDDPSNDDEALLALPEAGPTVRFDASADPRGGGMAFVTGTF